MLPNFKLLPDYTTLHMNGQSWLLVGGAISIDRIDRVLERTWWPGEAFQLRGEPRCLSSFSMLAKGYAVEKAPLWSGSCDFVVVQPIMSLSNRLKRQSIRKKSARLMAKPWPPELLFFSFLKYPSLRGGVISPRIAVFDKYSHESRFSSHR
jgi:hypothetical protein